MGKINLRERISYVMWRLRLQAVLPSAYVRNVNIEECGEKIVCVESGGKLVLDKRLNAPLQLREGVANALLLAANAMPNGYRLALVEGYRSHSRQIKCWEKERSEIKKRFPGESEVEIDRRTRLQVADPRSGPRGGHQTGAAVDVTLVNEFSIEYDMGTAVQEFSRFTPTDIAPSREIAMRRKILLKAMESQGFVNYPGEWWHFSRGDQLWAAYAKKEKAIYGVISQ